MSDSLSQLYGRRVPLTRPPSHLSGQAALEKTGATWQCRRCHHTVAVTDQLPQGDHYCRQCLNLGRLTVQTKLYTIPEPNRFPHMRTTPLSWSGQLSRQQTLAAQTLIERVQSRTNQLLWAVTGAGKTEIVYPALAWALQQRWRVAWTSPRVDVCLELAPRLATAFREVPQAVLYGGQPEPYAYRQLTICTTHQLLRFEAAFDWIVVDEVDAFPLATDPMLQRAILRAQKPGGCHLLLTATPGQQLQRQVRRGQLAVTYLPLRYHGYLLPEIQTRIAWRWPDRLAKHQLPPALLRRLWRWQRQDRPFLVFVPHVRQLAPVAAAMVQRGIAGGATVHAADPQRREKVQALREHRLSYLVTTTILERGVTFPNVAVAILGADDPVFSTAALVQIAGRVGRHRDHPGGIAWAFVQSQTLPVLRAQRMIRQLNGRGRRLGGQRG